MRHAEIGESSDGLDPAVSDLVGFSLMFGIIIVSVGIVSMGGMADILEFGDRQEVNTAERGMTAAAAELETLDKQADLNKNFELVLATGNVFVNESTLGVSAGDKTEELPINSLEHQFDRGSRTITVSYESGGVFRSDSISPRKDPTVVCDGDSAFVSVMNITTDETIDIALASPQGVSLDVLEPPEDVPVADFASTVPLQANVISEESERVRADDVSLDVSETANRGAWERTLEAHGWDENDGTYECDAERVLVRVTTVELSQFGQL